MSIFRKPNLYYTPKPKVALASYRDLTMPRRDWLKLSEPAHWRLPARSVCAAQIESQERV